MDPHAQYEIRAYGRVMAGMLQRVAPLTYEAWIDYDVMGARMSRGELEALSHLVEPDGEEGLRLRADAEALDPQALAEIGLSPREIRELVAKLRPGPRPDFTLDLSEMRDAESVAAEMEAAVPTVPE